MNISPIKDEKNHNVLKAAKPLVGDHQSMTHSSVCLSNTCIVYILPHFVTRAGRMNVISQPLQCIITSPRSIPLVRATELAINHDLKAEI